jgi:hypothetical protein
MNTRTVAICCFVSRPTILAAAIFASGVSLACSESSPLAPVSAVADGRETLEARAAKPPGVYELSFARNETFPYEPLDPLVPVPAGKGIRLIATVRNQLTDLPVTDGTFIFERCWAQGDLAPLEACEGPSGQWSIFGRSVGGNVPAPGTLVDNLISYSPTTIGVRFRYLRGSVADGGAGPVNLVWF